MNKVLPFILIVLCINTANADYESDADATLMQIKTESALKSNDATLLNEIQNVEEVHTGDTFQIGGDVSTTSVYSASSNELNTPKGKEQAKAAQVMVGLPVRKHFLSKDFANRDVSELFIQTPKGEVNYSTLAKTMGWGEDDSSYQADISDKDNQDAKAFWMGKESFDQTEPEPVSNVEIASAEQLLKNYRDKEAVYKAGGMSKEQYLELLGDTMTGENHDVIMKYMMYKNQSGKYIEPDPVSREKKRISHLTRTGHGRVNTAEETRSDTLKDMGKMIAIAIALGQTIPIIVTAFLTKKKSSILVATVIMLILAAITGNPAFFAMDAIFIGAAHFICVNAIEES